MGRPAGGKNRKLTAEEKETIVLEYLNGRAGYKTVARAHDISESLFYRWIEKYQNPHFSSKLKWGSRAFFDLSTFR